MNWVDPGSFIGGREGIIISCKEADGCVAECASSQGGGDGHGISDELFLEERMSAWALGLGSEDKG